MEGDNEPHKLPSDPDIHITHTYHARSCRVIINLNFNVVIIREETECEHSKLRNLNSLWLCAIVWGQHSCMESVGGGKNGVEGTLSVGTVTVALDKQLFELW